MKSIGVLFPALVILLLSAGLVAGRASRIWSYQELLDKSDLTVIATPTASNDTKEHGDHPNQVGQPVIGVETRFAVSVVIKGDRGKDFVLHHYRADKMAVPNAPTFVSFDPAGKRTYLLFLVREADGRYAPVVGQADPGLGVKELVDAAR